MSAGEMQKTMGLLGVAMLLFSLFFPGISDKAAVLAVWAFYFTKKLEETKGTEVV